MIATRPAAAGPLTRGATLGRVDTSTPVLVLTASPRARRSPHGGIGIIRSLGRLGVPVFTVDSDPRGPASYSRYLRERFMFELAIAEPEEAIDYLLGIGSRMRTRPVLIPTWDEASLLVSDFADVLSERFLFPVQPVNLARALASKKEMFQLARRHDVPTPGAVFPSGIEDVRDFAATATFPVMLKGISGNRLLERAGRKMLIVQRPDDLLRLYEEMEDPEAPNLMLQEYIAGGEDSVWMFNGYFDGASDCLFGITGRKLRQTPIYTGATSLGVCQRNDIVDETTRRWMRELGYRGILDIGYRFDARDGQYKVLDVNPRIGGTFRLFVASNGLDVARALYLDLTGQQVPPGEPVEGRKWLDSRDFQTSLQHWREGSLTPRQWFGSLGGVQETVYFARDDLAPFMRHLRYLFSQFVRPRSAVARTETVRLLEAAKSERKRSEVGLQETVDRHFEAASEEWRTIYLKRSVLGLIYQERREIALAWTDALGLPHGARVLEIGCGAGLTSVALAERGLDVTAVDSVPAMAQLTEQLARDRGVVSRVHVSVADTHHLPLPDGAFTLVVALGVFPWLHSPLRAMEEIARVTQPGGYVLASSDNALRLNHLLDPRLNPLLSRARPLLGRALRDAGILHRPAPNPGRFDTPRGFRTLFESTNLWPERGATSGFGPFSIWLRQVLSDGDGIRLHRALQGLADRGVPVIRSLGAQHLILARRPIGTIQKESHR